MMIASLFFSSPALCDIPDRGNVCSVAMYIQWLAMGFHKDDGTVFPDHSMFSYLLLACQDTGKHLGQVIRMYKG